MGELGELPHRSVCRTLCAATEAAEVECENCGLDPVCLVLDYAEPDSGVPEGILLRHCPVARGETLFRHDDPFRSIFAVKSGAFKTFVPHSDRVDQVVGFQFPGELIGVEAMAGDRYPCSAKALENSIVCELRLERLPEAGKPLEALQHSVIELLGKEVAFNHELISTLVHQSAEQRIAGFLLSISNRLQRRNMPGSVFNLSMSRADIGNYLGLASETVSRILTRFQKSGWVLLERKRASLIDRPALEKLSAG